MYAGYGSSPPGRQAGRAGGLGGGAVVTDVEMPGSLDGFTLARLVHKAWPHIGIVVVSARAGPGPGGGCVPASVCGCATAPWCRDRRRTVLRRQLRLRVVVDVEVLRLEYLKVERAVLDLVLSEGEELGVEGNDGEGGVSPVAARWI